MDRFRQLRERNLVELTGLNLTPAQFELTGEHPTFGTVTLAQLLATWVAHDLGHLAQITRVMAKQYRNAVGPWEAFLPVLHDALRYILRFGQGVGRCHTAWLEDLGLYVVVVRHAAHFFDERAE